MAHKHLRELLTEDQESFILQNYIEEKRRQLKRSVPRNYLQINKRKPISGNSIFPANFCKNTCLFSFHDSPDFKKSPMFGFSSPLKSPSCKSLSKLFVHIPSRTAALLLEAAIRIQEHPSPSKSHSTSKILGSGFLCSILKRINLCKKNQRLKTKEIKMRVSAKDMLKWDSSAMEKHQYQENMEALETNRAVSELGSSCSCNSRLARLSPCDGCRKPEFESPAASPRRHIEEVEEREKEEKEQSSPVSVLDQPFETDVDDDAEGDNRHDQSDSDYELDLNHHRRFEKEEGDSYDDDALERSFAIVQRAKQQLLHKLRRFEKLADLNPIEPEKGMLGVDEDETEECVDEEDDDSSGKDSIVESVLGRIKERKEKAKSPRDMKKLILDLISEERRENIGVDNKMVVNNVSTKLEGWSGVESDTIDMMVDQELRREGEEWKRSQAQVSDIAIEIELAIFGLLLQELSDEAVHS